LTAKTPLERVQESEKLLERIMLVVPGFRGYKLREQRREADRIVRDYIYRALEQSRDDLTSCLQALSDSKALELMEPMNRLLAKLDRIAEKINHASYGYSGFFDSIKIEEVELDKMLSYDTQLMDLVRKFSATTASFKSDLTQNKLENARTVQKDLEASVANLESTFDERKSVIEGVKV
jgi:DNA repair ATPase RecN